jgi:hypothetical protein
MYYHILRGAAGRRLWWFLWAGRIGNPLVPGNSVGWKSASIFVGSDVGPLIP